MTAVDFMFRVQPFPADDMLLTTCPKCQHHFPLLQPCCQGVAEMAGPLVVSATLTLPSSPCVSASCALTVQARRVQVGMTGGGLVSDSGPQPSNTVILQRGGSGGQLTVNCRLGSPEPSPSDPIAFVIPTPPPPHIHAGPWTFPPPHHSQSQDLERISTTLKALRMSGWYYEGLSWKESARLLVGSSPGTFLVRDSSDSRFLFSLSVQTDRGPTSVRLHYIDGNFRLDASPKLVPDMPVFPCVVRLIEYYVSATSGKRETNSKEQVWIDCSGHTYSNILLSRPLYQKDRFPSLQHLARLSIHRLSRSGRFVPTLGLPESLSSYLADYPYSQ